MLNVWYTVYNSLWNIVKQTRIWSSIEQVNLPDKDKEMWTLNFWVKGYTTFISIYIQSLPKSTRSLRLSLQQQHLHKHPRGREGIPCKNQHVKVSEPNHNSRYQWQGKGENVLLQWWYPCISFNHLSIHNMWYSWRQGRTLILSPSSYSPKQM